MTQEMTDGEYFNQGSFVRCTLTKNQLIEGNVLAFDLSTKILILKSVSSDNSKYKNDINFVNLLYVNDIEVIRDKECDLKVPLSTMQDINKIVGRYKKQTENRYRLLVASKKQVSLEGKNLFFAISSVLGKETKWKGDDIAVYDEDILISPPYRVDCIKGLVDSDHYNYVKRLAH